MLIELENIIFSVASSVDLTNGIVSKNEYDQCVLELKKGFPTVNIAPYDELIFGTSYAVQLCRSLAAKSIILTPDHVADALLNELRKKNTSGIKVFLGEKTFVNFDFSPEFITDHCRGLLKLEVQAYLNSILIRLNLCFVKKLQIDLEYEFKSELSSRSDIDYQNILQGYDQKQKLDFYLNYIADEEAEETVLERENYFQNVVSEIIAGFPTGRKLFSQSPYTHTSSAKRLTELNLKIKHFLLLFPFLLLDTFKQGRAKIFYKEFVEVRNAINAIWTDKLLREQLLNSQVFNKGEISFLRDSILWLSKLNEAIRKEVISPLPDEIEPKHHVQ